MTKIVNKLGESFCLAFFCRTTINTIDSSRPEKVQEICIGKNHAHSIGLFTRDYQSLCLDYCKITKPEFKALCVVLGDEI